MRRFHAAAAAIVATSAVMAAEQPNFVFLLGESMDGRLWRPDSPAPIPNVRSLISQGVTFDWTYSNAPVCCPSRASMLTGRYPHKVKHMHNGIVVDGVWNNYEGLPSDDATRKATNLTTVFDILAENGFEVNTAGKTDWSDGAHSESAYLEAWTHNVAFPYNISSDGGWNQEDDVCGSNGTIMAGGTSGPQGSAYAGDWTSLQDSIEWLKKQAAAGKPFMAYQGFNIVHPPYVTNEYWYGQVNASEVTVPVWKPLEEMHPCALQQSMLKGCTPSDANYSFFHDPNRIRNIRQIQLATIAEWDAMVGAYIKAVQEAGIWNNTIWILAADHGDMALEQQQFYKMVPYEASTHVPLVISVPQVTNTQVVSQPTQLLDLFPTILDLAGLHTSTPPYIDGYSLTPFLQGAASDPTRPPYVMSQFHGDDIAMSWFLVVNGSYASTNGSLVAAGAAAASPSGAATRVAPKLSSQASEPMYKYISYGLGPGATYPGYPGVTINPQLFDLASDPGELSDLWSDASPAAAALETTLRSMIDYPSVAMDVATYQKSMFQWWVGQNKDWEKQLAEPSVVRWADAWSRAPAASLAAVKSWLAAPVAIMPCRNGTSASVGGH